MKKLIANNNTKKTAVYFIAALSLIALLFIITACFTYIQFSKNTLSREFLSQEKTAGIISDVLMKYFNTLTFITQNAVLQPAFKEADILNDIKKLHQPIELKIAQQAAQQQKIRSILFTPQESASFNKNFSSKQPLQHWQLFKGLALDDPLAIERRQIANNILKIFPNIQYIFLTTVDGSIIFIAPYDIQKHSNSFNYGYRNSIKQVNTTRQTSISDIYLSHVSKPTQTITVASPVFDNQNKFSSILGVTLSANTLNKMIFKELSQHLNIADGTVFYLIDQHAHVIASSSGNNIYFPTPNQNTDNFDFGNFRKLHIFDLLQWHRADYEKGSIWQRKTASWDSTSLAPIYRHQYNNAQNILVIGTFLPIALQNHSNIGILVESPVNQIFATAIHLKHVFLTVGFLLLVMLGCLFIFSFKKLRDLETALFQEQKNKEEVVLHIASQVAHDIRSPVAALNMIIHHLTDIPEKTRTILRNVTQQITDIANNLLTKHRKEENTYHQNAVENNPSTPELISALLDNMISSKRMQFSSHNLNIQLNIMPEAQGVFSAIVPTELKRVLSNLINNAAEAMQHAGLISVTLKKAQNNLFLTIQDNGCGMFADTLEKVIKGGVSIGKEGGHGLGLASSKSKVEAWNGKFDIESLESKGTTITIQFPVAEVPNWFQSTLAFINNSTVIILDDDKSIHDIWETRIQSLCKEDFHLNIIHFNQAELFLNYDHTSLKKSFYLIDYELLGSELTGLDTIEKLNISQHATLVTSRYEDLIIRNRCLKYGCKILPKNYAPFIPIYLIPQNLTFVLIDDDELLASTWKMSADNRKHEIMIFHTTAEAFQVIPFLPKHTPIYIDSHLSQEECGEVFAEKLSQIGYTELYLATGYNPEKFKKFPWLKGIVGKGYPL